jgi:hypothetical protein
MLGARPAEGHPEREALVGREGPLAHLGVRAGRQIDPADRPVADGPVGRGHRREPVGIGVERLEEPLDPAALAPAVVPGGRPGAELLAVVAHRPEPLAVIGRVVAEVADHVVDLGERDPVAETLLRPEDGQDLALVVGRVRPPQVVLGDGRRPEMGVVEDGPVVAGRDEGRRQVGLPDALGEPGAARPAAEGRLDLVGHPAELADTVALGQGGEDRLVPAAADDLDLAALGKGGEAADELGPLGAEPGKEGAGVVEGDADPGMTLEGADHREVGPVVGLGDHPAEVADGLVIVEGQRQRDPAGHAVSSGRVKVDSAVGGESGSNDRSRERGDIVAEDH